MKSIPGNSVSTRPSQAFFTSSRNTLVSIFRTSNFCLLPKNSHQVPKPVSIERACLQSTSVISICVPKPHQKKWRWPVLDGAALRELVDGGEHIADDRRLRHRCSGTDAVPEIHAGSAHVFEGRQVLFHGRHVAKLVHGVPARSINAIQTTLKLICQSVAVHAPPKHLGALSVNAANRCGMGIWRPGKTRQAARRRRVQREEDMNITG
jgi:hypothetical protein